MQSLIGNVVYLWRETAGAAMLPDRVLSILCLSQLRFESLAPMLEISNFSW